MMNELKLDPQAEFGVRPFELLLGAYREALTMEQTAIRYADCALLAIGERT